MHRTHSLDTDTGLHAAGLEPVAAVHRNAALADAAFTTLLIAGPQCRLRVAQHMGIDHAPTAPCAHAGLRHQGRQLGP
jgi:thiamine biosynthesis lipoprotein ApbE